MRRPGVTNVDVTAKRQFIEVRFEIDLPLKPHEVDEAVRLLEGVLAILRTSQRGSEPTQAAGAVDPVAGVTTD